VGVPPTAREDFFMATMLIDGQTVAAQTGKTIEVRNPANGEVVDTIPKGSASEVDAAVEAMLARPELGMTPDPPGADELRQIVWAAW